MKLDIMISHCRMMEDSSNVMHDLIHWDFWMVPSVNHSRCDILQDYGSHLSGWRVQDVREVILRKHRMCRVS